MTGKDNNGRDARGRWTKGHCPNPNGRPKKEPEISDSDVLHFKNSVVTATINGQERVVSRHELLLHSMYDQALKGKTSIARKLFDRFEDADLTMEKARDAYREMREQFLTKYYENDEFDEKLAEEYLKFLELVIYGKTKH